MSKLTDAPRPMPSAASAAGEKPPLDRFLREPEVARLTGLSRATRWRMERRGQFPRRRQISANGVAWLESEILTWMRERAPATGGVAA